MERQTRQLRAALTRFETREEGETPHITGYFAVFGSNYEIAPQLSESIAPGAFSGSLGGDVRALTNHDTTLVLGRTAAGTLTLREDEHGLWGDVQINPNDQDAMNTYARVARGDVSQCSIGFEIIREEAETSPDGSVHWTIREVNLYEVSVCTFPAYEQTNVQARSDEAAELKRRQLEAWKIKMREVLKNGPQSPDAPEKA